MISTLNDDNYMYIRPMIEACRECMYFNVYKYMYKICVIVHGIEYNNGTRVIVRLVYNIQ